MVGENTMSIRTSRGRVSALAASALTWVAAAASVQAQSTAPSSAGLTLTPRNGQSAAQQTADRSECAHWAKDQTGFDETATGGGVAADAYFSKRQQYERAMGACLDAHGYSVRYAAASPAAAVVVAAPVGTYYSAPPANPGYGAAIYRASYTPAPAFTWSPFHVHVDGGVTFTTGDTGNSFDAGGNVGVGFSLFPARSLPLGLRVDGSYAYHDATDQFLYATNASYGHEEVYGGDLDLQLNLVQLFQQQTYLLGGIGWYRTRTELHQVTFVGGCNFYFCGVYPGYDAEAVFTSSWQNAWNIGAGWEFAIADRGSFFVEARYLHIRPNSTSYGQEFVPLRFGFRF
jgi:hypothetical protein